MQFTSLPWLLLPDCALLHGQLGVSRQWGLSLVFPECGHRPAYACYFSHAQEYVRSLQSPFCFILHILDAMLVLHWLSLITVFYKTLGMNLFWGAQNQVISLLWQGSCLLVLRLPQPLGWDMGSLELSQVKIPQAPLIFAKLCSFLWIFFFNFYFLFFLFLFLFSEHVVYC